MEDKIINKVAKSGIININLETFYPKETRFLFDIKALLYEGLILKEKDFRAFIKNEDWSTYQDKYVAVICSEDAIVPTWAYMLLAAHLTPFAKKVVFGDLETLETALYQELLHKLPINVYKDARVVIKGCGDLPVPVAAFVEITRLLRPVAKSIIYGEACSMVPLYKQPK
tara:strand:+ start:644 stop:1153 length:510 start_codon:yes stop_codon:yes gene_type:complete